MRIISFLCVLFLISSCKQNNKQPIVPIWTVVPIESPAGQSGEPNLFSTSDGQLYLSWVEYTNDTTDVLQFSRLEKNGWSAPISIASGTDWFVNWADFPSLAVYPDGKKLAAHFLAKSANGTYDYDVHITQSADAGQSWSESFILHSDGVAAEHGFVSLMPISGGRIFAAWLDGRNSKKEKGAMTLRSATFDANGQLYDEVELDNKVCDCCQTDATLTDNGPIVAYRDRSEEEMRDIALVRKVNGQWTEPKVIFPDNWQIAGCPVNGPSLSAKGQQVVIAWYTAANDQPSVKVAFSKDGGATFSDPIQIDQGNPLGRVDALMLDNGQAVVSWMEEVDEQAEIRVVKMYTNQQLSEPAVIATNSAARSSGFPILAQANNELYIAWTQVEGAELTHVRTARFGWTEDGE